ncbi:hypothetical protein GE118_03850 [Mycoplasma sp. NEAQ87857]|uniref:MSC_0621 family F1-like ATPase epsilon subunit n=1 Tax=Mycoplasma sp. NEAQ87857 TaxID=2683967 RepID=UPI0013192F41|nr:hypothetical protein [Mycoplasma sp. NEAQ87857]QGZ97916.1 hypothetical protein GE118_03850 [Mycoplasma sp. NEAQ87857]
MTKQLTLEFVSQTLDTNKIEIIKLEINNNLKDSWTVFKHNSVASFKQCLFRITTIDKQVIYFILENAFMLYLEDTIKIKYNGKLYSYVISENKNDFILQTKEKLTQLNNQLQYLKATNELNVSSIINSNIDQIMDKMYKHKAIYNFSLQPKEVSWKEK